MKQYTVTGMSCAASASAASASPRACCTRLSPCTPTRSAPSCRRMISQDSHTAVACRMQPTEKVSHTAFGKTAPCVRCVVRNPHLAEKAESENEQSEDEKTPKRKFGVLLPLCVMCIVYQ